MQRGLARTAVVVAALLALTTDLRAVPLAAGVDDAATMDAVIERLLALPYDATYVPSGTDAAFTDGDYPAAFPLTDTTTGTCCLAAVPDQPPLADLAPPFARFPDGFELIELESFDGTPLHAYVADADPGAPGVVVAHGFNTNGKHSVVRYAAALQANGFAVIAPDHRDVGREWDRGGSWHPSGERRGQTLGWKEAQDFLVAAATLHERGAARVGMLGFSEGAQNAILAAAADHDGLLDAVMTFSAPADQASLAQRSEVTTRALLTTVVNQPDLCTYLGEVGARHEFTATPNFILRQDSAVDALDGLIGTIAVPGVHFSAADDLLVPSWNATILASRTLAMPLQETVLIESGNHAYFTDRWWTQAAALEWFRTWLDPEHTSTTGVPTVPQPALGTPLSTQTIDLAGTTRADGDAERRPQSMCPASATPVGPTARLLADGVGTTWTFDGRRSYSGWDDHDLASWTLDLGDGTRLSGGDIAAASVTHTYRRPGDHVVVFEVTDDSGRSAAATRTVTIDRPGSTPRCPPQAAGRAARC